MVLGLGRVVRPQGNCTEQPPPPPSSSSPEYSGGVRHIQTGEEGDFGGIGVRRCQTGEDGVYGGVSLIVIGTGVGVARSFSQADEGWPQYTWGWSREME